MSTLLLLYQTEVNEQIVAAKTAQSAVAASLEAQRQNKDDPSVAYEPPPPTGPASRPAIIREGLARLSQAREVLSSFQSEVSQQPSADQPRLRLLAVGWEREVEALEAALGELRDAAVVAAEEDLLLFSSTSGGRPERVEGGQELLRRSAAYTTQRLQQGTGHLDKAERLLHTTNQVGHDTFRTLQGQTEQIRGVGEVVVEVDGELSQANSIMRTMQRTAIRQKIYLYAFIALIVIVLLVILYMKIFR